MLGKTNAMNKKIVLEELSVTPTASGVTMTAEDGKGYSKVSVAGDAKLIPANIKKGVNIFGVTGTAKVATVKTGTYTTTNSDGSSQQIKIPHGLGKVPSYCGITSDIMLTQNYASIIEMNISADKTNIIITTDGGFETGAYTGMRTIEWFAIGM